MKSIYLPLQGICLFRPSAFDLVIITKKQTNIFMQVLQQKIFQLHCLEAHRLLRNFDIPILYLIDKPVVQTNHHHLTVQVCECLTLVLYLF